MQSHVFRISLCYFLFISNFRQLKLSSITFILKIYERNMRMKNSFNFRRFWSLYYLTMLNWSMHLCTYKATLSCTMLIAIINEHLSIHPQWKTHRKKTHKVTKVPYFYSGKKNNFTYFNFLSSHSIDFQFNFFLLYEKVKFILVKCFWQRKFF